MANNCFLCDSAIVFRHKGRNKHRRVMTIQIKETVLQKAIERKDVLGRRTRSRLENCHDLVAEEAVYHPGCMSKFLTDKNACNDAGRPINVEKTTAFEKMCDWLERDNSCDLYTLHDLLIKMKELGGGISSVYGEKSLKLKLQKKYKEHIYFTDLPGLPMVVGFRDMTSHILWKMKENQVQTKDSIIIAAAKLIKAELREIDKTNEVYPTLEEISSSTRQEEWVPGSMQLLLNYLLSSSLKQLSIGQCITQASRPQSIICPVTFGLGIQLEKRIGSKWLIEQLQHLGYSISYIKVMHYTQAAVEQSPQLPLDNNGVFVQWVADNVDHNQVTLRGKDTFHEMGIMSITANGNFSDEVIRRTKERRKAFEFVAGRRIPIIDYQGRSQHGLSKLKFQPVKLLAMEPSHPMEVQFNLLWQCSWFFSCIKLQLVRLHAKLDTKLQYSKKRSHFFFAHRRPQSLR